MEMQASSGNGPSFYLVPENGNAQRVLSEPSNHQYIKYKDGQPAIHLDFAGVPDSEISLGLKNCHITLPDHHGVAGISRKHCYFKCHPLTGVVILHDRSHNHSTQVYDKEDDCIVPISQVMNSVAVTRRFNRSIAIGTRKYYRFRLVWGGDALVENFLLKPPNTLGPEKHPFDPSKARYIQGQFLGMGGFGIVWRAINIHTGQAMAVKRFLNLEGKGHVMAIREVNNMLKLSSNNARQHDHILPILDVEIDRDHYRWIEILMPLRDGSVHSLIEIADRAMTDAEIAEDVLYQMALALKFLARYKMVHRDIKPANILYETRLQADGISSYYHFQLADFNLSNESASARTFAGTQTFMAPEVYDRKLQSCNADIWSLFVTIVWIHNVDDFRSYITEDKIQLRDKITEISQQAMFANICDMAIQDPKYRVSARDLVSRLEGTSTRMPPTASGSTVTSMTQGPSGNEQGDASFTFVPYISDEIARGFSSNFSSRPTIGSSSMNGQSALGEFSGVAGPSTTTIYHNGRINEDYGYQYPRNEDVMADGEAAFAATTEDVPEGDGEEGGGEGEGVRYGHAYLY